MKNITLKDFTNIQEQQRQIFATIVQLENMPEGRLKSNMQAELIIKRIELKKYLALFN